LICFSSSYGIIFANNKNTVNMQGQVLYVVHQWTNDEKENLGHVLGVYNSELTAEQALRIILEARREDFGGTITSRMAGQGKLIYTVENQWGVTDYTITPSVLNAAPTITRLANLQAQTPIMTIPQANTATVELDRPKIRETLDQALYEVERDATAMSFIRADMDDDSRYDTVDHFILRVLQNRPGGTATVDNDYARAYLSFKIWEFIMRLDPSFGPNGGVQRL
jgi:hypothetical protein